MKGTKSREGALMSKETKAADDPQLQRIIELLEAMARKLGVQFVNG
jgi:hypothetical protein